MSEDDHISYEWNDELGKEQPISSGGGGGGYFFDEDFYDPSSEDPRPLARAPARSSGGLARAPARSSGDVSRPFFFFFFSVNRLQTATKSPQEGPSTPQGVGRRGPTRALRMPKGLQIRRFCLPINYTYLLQMIT